MNGKIKISWDLSEYYSSLEDENFLKDWNFFVKKSEKFIKNYSMKIPNFHTYENLVEFYQDFEGILGWYEKLRYFLHYKVSLDIFDQKAHKKIQKLEEISGNFLARIGDLYKIFYTETSETFFENIKKTLKKGDNPYQYTAQKFLQDLDFYKNASEIFFKNKQEIESEIREFTIMQEQNNTLFYAENISDQDFIKNSIKNFFALIALRTELLSYSPYKSVSEMAFAEMGISKNTIDIMMNSCLESKLFNVPFYPEDDSYISFSDAISLLKKVIYEKNSTIGKYFDFCLENGYFDFSPNPNKSPNSFTSFHKGKNPRICVNFSSSWNAVITIIHEFGHAYQMKTSENITRMEILASPFMSEFSASFFEKFLEEFCYSHWEFSFQYQKMQERKKNILTNALNISVLEGRLYNDFLAHRFSDETSFELYLRELGLDDNGLINFFTQIHIFHTPLYLCAYIFAYCAVENIFSHSENMEIFEKIISQGGSNDVEKIFAGAGIGIRDRDFYKNGFSKIFS